MRGARRASGSLKLVSGTYLSMLVLNIGGQL